jgi:hypothetical protein
VETDPLNRRLVRLGWRGVPPMALDARPAPAGARQNPADSSRNPRETLGADLLAWRAPRMVRP